MLDWMKKKEGSFISDTNGEDIFEGAKKKLSTLMLVGPTQDYRLKMAERNLSFQENALNIVDDLLDSLGSIQIIRTESTRLTAMKLCQGLKKKVKYKSEDSFIILTVNRAIRLQNKLLDFF